MRAAVEGFELGAHRFRSYKTDDDEHQLTDVHHAVGADRADAFRLGEVSAAATLLVRELGNTPPVDKRPPAAPTGPRNFWPMPIEVTILDEAALVEGGYGGHWPSVPARRPSRAWSSWPTGRRVRPRTWPWSARASPSTPAVCRSSRPRPGVDEIDMAGSATVLAVVRAVAQLELPMPCGADVPRGEHAVGVGHPAGRRHHHQGRTTVEVLNTDAEGRLVLADGLDHAGELDPAPDAIVDLATLTGGVIAALGPKFTGLMTEDDGLRDSLLAAADTSDEPMWELPLGVFQYDADLKSDIADIRNVGGEGASTTRAGLFLRRFRPDGIPWAHLDIAGAAWNNSSPFHEVPKGATGLPARTIIDWLRTR